MNKEKNVKSTTVVKSATATTTTENVTQADKIWTEIKDKNIQMFALPIQKVSDYCAPIPVEPTRLFLTYKVSAVLPALEEALGQAFKIEQADKFLIVSKVK